MPKAQPACALAFYDDIYLIGAPFPYYPFEVYFACYYCIATGNQPLAHAPYVVLAIQLFCYYFAAGYRFDADAYLGPPEGPLPDAPIPPFITY